MKTVEDEKLEELIQDYNEIMGCLGMHYIENGLNEVNDVDYNILNIEEIIRRIVIGEIVRRHTWIDEAINDVILNYFIPRKQKNDEKRHDIFRDNIIDKISFCSKLEIVRKIYNMPDEVHQKILKINSLRNDIAHNFSPEERKKTKAIYRKERIYSEAGVSLFISDIINIQEFFNKLTPLS